MSSNTHEALFDGQKAFMRVSEVARFLDISINLTLRLLRARRLPGIKLGKVWRVERKALTNYLQRVTADAERRCAEREAP
jgi:excisionase family DNA binding protein